MNFKIVIRPRADRDLEEIQEYLSQFGKSRPEKFMEKFRDAVDSISYSPWFKKLEWDNTCRYVQVWKYSVIYRIDEETNIVRIHRVLHGSMNFRRGVDIEVMEEMAEYESV